MNPIEHGYRQEKKTFIGSYFGNTNAQNLDFSKYVLFGVKMPKEYEL